MQLLLLRAWEKHPQALHTDRTYLFTDPQNSLPTASYIHTYMRVYRATCFNLVVRILQRDSLSDDLLNLVLAFAGRVVVLRQQEGEHCPRVRGQGGVEQEDQGAGETEKKLSREDLGAPSPSIAGPQRQSSFCGGKGEGGSIGR